MTLISPNFVCQQSSFALAVHPGLAANVPLRRHDPLVRPPEVSVQVPHRSHDRRDSIAETGMGLENANSASSLRFAAAMGPIPSIAESPAYSSQGRIAPSNPLIQEYITGIRLPTRSVPANVAASASPTDIAGC
jgi:hypothetical protein